MPRKVYTGAFELKDGGSGEFRATIATLNVLDRDGDVIVPGAFKSGQKVKVAAWGHNWDALPVGLGKLGADADHAWVDGKFFLDTPQGQAHYQTVKNLGPLQEWSFGFNVDKWSAGQFEKQDARFIEGIDTFEVSPVMLGAGIGTGTDYIKAAAADYIKAAAEGAIAEPPPFPDAPETAPIPESEPETIVAEVVAPDATVAELAAAALASIDGLLALARGDSLTDADARKALALTVERLGKARGEIEAHLKRTDLSAQAEPRNLYAQFLELGARHRDVPASVWR